MAKSLTYEQAYAELEQISEDIQSESISIDQLAEKVKKASELITFCREKLRSTEEEVNNIISQMEKKTKEK